MESQQLSSFYQKLIQNISDDPITNIEYSDKWCIVQTKESSGFAMMCPSHHPTDLQYLNKKQSLKELASEISSFNFGHASIAMAAVNCHYNSDKQLKSIDPSLDIPSSIDLCDLIETNYLNKSIVSIGSFAFLRRINSPHIKVIEKNPKVNEYPDTAAEYLIKEADLVLMTGATLINKSFERLNQLSRDKQVFLIGPSVPFIPDLFNQNISLFGYTILQAQNCLAQIQQGLGKKLLSSTAVARLNNL
ncbi:MAG: hypothetical protein KC646_02785 [Candidatus Cloacimonetes bacterium]|nr:hypothetical protein [Candidatus Cloacimonadota bacterium]